MLGPKALWQVPTHTLERYRKAALERARLERLDDKVRVPNPHGSDIGIDLLRRILRQAGISEEEWMRV